jgi:NADH:ubiquinone oxidoreductase subunit F (NADH-binding)
LAVSDNNEGEAAMNDMHLYAKAAAECAYLLDGESIRILVAAANDNPAADASMAILTDWAGTVREKVKITRTGSFGYDDLEPMIMIEKPGQLPASYARITDAVAPELLRDVLGGGKARPDWALIMDGPVFGLEKRIALRNCGLVDPENIFDYIAGRHGYLGLAKALGLTPKGVIEAIRRSGLRNRVGSGDAAAKTWETVFSNQTSEKIVVCSALDSAPESRKTRLLVEGDPHSVLEGLLIASYAVGAAQAVIVIPEKCGFIKARLETALAQMRENGLVGAQILASKFHCGIEVKETRLTMTAGEATALLRFLEGRQALPYLREDEETAFRIHEKAALVTDIETLANVSAIFQQSAEWFAGVGSAGNAGTKVITLAGAIRHPYTVEVPYGTTLGSVIREIGGGTPDGNALKAVRFGGATSAYFNLDDLNKPIDYETAGQAGVLRGADTLEVIADPACAVEMTERLMALLHEQSCGKCLLCREGTLHLAHIMKDIAAGQGTAKELDLLEELGERMKTGAICSFGKSAANSVLSSLKLFAADFDYHIKYKKCPLCASRKEE